jgi:signal transduction histidine kinase
MKKAEILIVEDDALSALVIKKILADNDYKISGIIANGSDAVKAVDETKPDLILMDIMLKDGIDGIQAAEQIHLKYDIPIIYLTSVSNDETIQRAKITEPFGYLLKPVDKKTLITNVELSLQKQNTINKKILETLKKANDELEHKVIERTRELSVANEILTNEIKQRLKAEENLRRADKLATIGKMSAILAHEIRNPLNSIKINTDILHQALNLPENQKRRLHIIQKEVTRLDNLVKEVLMFSRQSNIIKTEINIFSLIESIINQLHPILNEKRVTVSNKVEDVTFKADSEKLKQVLLNMIINSNDAMEEEGLIELFSKINKPTNRIELFIKDNGTGIEDPAKLFEPFYTTKNSGTGLGLPVSLNIIEQHKGSINLISSRPGETIFCIELPLA